MQSQIGIFRHSGSRFLTFPSSQARERDVALAIQPHRFRTSEIGKSYSEVSEGIETAYWEPCDDALLILVIVVIKNKQTLSRVWSTGRFASSPEVDGTMEMQAGRAYRLP